MHFAAALTSVMVHSGGGAELLFQMKGGFGFLPSVGTKVRAVLKWPGGVCQLWEGSAGCRGGASRRPSPLAEFYTACEAEGADKACVVIETKTSVADSATGLAATAQVNNSFITPEVRTVDTEVPRDALSVTVADPRFRAYAPRGEDVQVWLSGELWAVDVWTELCKTSSRCNCTMPGGGCRFDATLVPQSNVFSSQSMVADLRVVLACISLTVMCVASPQSIFVATAFGRQGLLTQAALCPAGGDTVVDPLLNPMDFSFGSGDTAEWNGALIGGFLMRTVLLIVAGLVASFFYRVLETRSVRLRSVFTVSAGGESSAMTLTHPGYSGSTPSVDWVLWKARCGWVVIALSYFYGISVVSVSAALGGSSFGYKIAAAIEVFVFTAVLPALVFTAERRKTEHCEPGEFDPRTCLYCPAVLRGVEHWVARPYCRGWLGVRRLFISPYHPRRGKFCCVVELAALTLLGMLCGLWRPSTSSSCEYRAGMVAAIIILLLGYFAVCRPFAAPYENVLAGVVLFAESVCSVFVVSFVGKDRPTEEGVADTLSALFQIAAWVTFLKFLVDAAVFGAMMYDEWLAAEEAKPARRQDLSRLSFFRYWLWFGDVVDEDEMEKRPSVYSSAAGAERELDERPAPEQRWPAYSPGSDGGSTESHGYAAFGAVQPSVNRSNPALPRFNTSGGRGMRPVTVGRGSPTVSGRLSQSARR